MEERRHALALVEPAVVGEGATLVVDVAAFDAFEAAGWEMRAVEYDHSYKLAAGRLN